MANGTQPKPGIKTTEFWITGVLAFLGPVLTLLVGFGVVNPNDVTEITDTVTTSVNGIKDAVIVAITNITSLIAVKGYLTSRTEVKKAATGS